MTGRADARRARRRRRLAFVGLLVGALALAGVAFAFWASSDASNPAKAVADSIQAGSTPTLGGVNGQDVTLNWTATTTVSGASVTGYTIARYSVASGGTPTAATGGCSGTVTALTCTEQSVAAGTWYYAVTPKIALWAGAESGRLSVPVVAAAFSITGSQTIRTSGTISGGSLSHFKANETVTFRLDSAAGTVLTASTGAVDGSGAASGFTVTIPVGPADGAHTIVAVGGGGTQVTSNSFSIDNTAPVTTDNSASIGAGWFNTTKTVTLTPTDTGGSGVAATYYTTDGSTPTTGSTQGTSVALSSDGVFAVKYFSVDALGNAEAVKTAGTAIHIDKTNPTPATLSVPSFVKNGQALTNSATDPTVNGATSGVASVSYFYCSGASCTPSTLIGTSSTGPSFSVAWTSQPADGAYRVQAVATDVAGNSGSSSIASTTVDNTAPSGGSVTYSNGYFITASISVTRANGTDGTGSGVNSTTTQVQRASATLTNGTCGTFGQFGNVGSAGPASPFTDATVSSGNCYQYQYLVSDNVGNTRTYTSTNVAKVDTTAPLFTVATSGSNISSSGTTVFFKNVAGSKSFTVTASDPDSGIGTPTFGAAPTGWTRSVNGNVATYTWTTASVSSSFVVSATNGAGGSSGNQTITITVDGTAPVMTNANLAIAPIDNTTTAGFIHQGGQYYVYANASDAASGIGGVTANVANITTGSTAVPLVAGSYTVGATTYGYRSAALTANAVLTAGTKTYTGTATDKVGNAITTANASVTVDNTNPTGSITAPTNGWATASTTVTSNSADATANVASAVFQYSPAGAGTWTTFATDTASPFSNAWDTTGLTDGGSYDLRVVTTDNASNTFTSPTVTVTVDRTVPAAPSTPVLAPASDSGVQGDNLTNDTTPTFTGTAEAGATVSLYNGPTFVASGVATGGTWSITTPAGTDGSYVITATATDPAGNVSTSSGSVTITIDATVPAVTAARLANGTGTAGTADAGDTATFTFSEQLNAASICSAWNNTGPQTLTNATVTLTQAGTTDTLGVTTSSCTFNFGSDIVGNYVTATATFTNSTVAWDPTARTLTVTLGTFSSGTLTTGAAAKQKYTPVAAITDLAGNAVSATLFTDGTATGF